MQTEPSYQHLVVARFADLAARWPETAAAELPLVMWRDAIDGIAARLAHRHTDFFSLYFVRHGRGTHIIDGVPYSVARGDVYAMGVGMTHHFSDCEALAMDTLHFAPQFFDASTLDALAATPGFQSLFVDEPLRRAANGTGGRWLHLTPPAYAEVVAMLAELQTEWQAGTPEGILLTRGLFLRLLVALARRYAAVHEGGGRTAAPADSPHEATVAAAVAYLDDHFAETLRIEQVASSVFLSPDHFTKVFSAAMGRTPSDYLRHLRLERAKVLLRTTDAPVSAVAAQSGFGDPAYFVRTFRAATGLTPRGFRRG
jgi:AraC family transcriptional activator of pobA